VSPALIAAGAQPIASPWRLAGSGGTDRIDAALTAEEAAAAGAPFGLSLALAAVKKPVLHDGDGFVDFGPAGSSYYYSRTRMSATGTLELDGERLAVDGIAWFDHQWGDFVSVGAGGWDWFALNLDDGTDITLSIVRDENASAILQYGTLVSPTGAATRLDQEDFGVGDGFAAWTSPHSLRTYPISRSIVFPGVQKLIELRSTVADQELDTRATTGVIYWEGSQQVDVFNIDDVGNQTRIGGGDAYVEITRYDQRGG
jgi:predicted secreted hydrolase